MKCFIAIDEDLLLKLWMLDPQLVAPYSQADFANKKPINSLKDKSKHQLTECQLSIVSRVQT